MIVQIVALKTCLKKQNPYDKQMCKRIPKKTWKDETEVFGLK